MQAKTQKVQQEKAASKILAGTQNIKGLEEKLQVGRAQVICSNSKGKAIQLKADNCEKIEKHSLG